MSQAQLLAEACSGGWNTVGCLAACSQRSCWRRSILLRAVSRVLSGHTGGQAGDVAVELSSWWRSASLVTGLFSSDVAVLTLATRTRPSLPG